MKVQLIVVRGKPEGKIIPLTGPKFKIGRGETCHLRPVNEQVSREHAEFEIVADKVMVRDLGSRNGTLVNGKAITQVYNLKDRDLVQVGPLTFAVSIQVSGAVAANAKPAAPAKAAAAAIVPPKPRAASPDDLSNDDIDSWLLGDGSGQSGDQPTIYGGDTKTITAFKDKDASANKDKDTSANRPSSVVNDSQHERQDEEEDEDEEEDDEDELENEDEASLGDEDEEDEDEEDDDEDEEDDDEAVPQEEFIDESNPFYAAKKAQKDKPAAGETTGAANQTFKDSSDAANDILKKLMERRKASRS